MQETNIKQVKSKKRVTDHGEVFTAKREVDAMLDLVKQETERIDSRFLEPACGNGNFLTEVLIRKLNVVKSRYSKSQIEFERNSFTAVASIYGIDILEDNAIECRIRLYIILNTLYKGLFTSKVKEEFLKTIKFVLQKNIIWGDALTLKKVTLNNEPIIFSQWALVTGSLVQRTDFSFTSLMNNQALDQPNLFSDLGDKAFIPTPINNFPLTNLYQLAVDEQYQL
jgi:hypothetical protein